MSDAVLVALITGACAVIGQWLISRKQNQDRAVAEAVRDAKIEDRIKAVEKKLDIHNGYAEKLGEIQQDISQMQTDVAVIKNEVKHLKEAKA